MNKKYLVAASFFGISVFVLTLYFLFGIEFVAGNDLGVIVLLSGVLTYAVLYFIFIIIISHYSSWKKFFYDDRINFIRKYIKRQKRLSEEIYGVLFLSLIVNFFSVYFILITTPNQIISRIPGFEGIELLTGESNGDVYSLMSSFTRVDYFLPLTIVGISSVFILRFLYVRRINKGAVGSQEQIPYWHSCMLF